MSKKNLAVVEPLESRQLLSVSAFEVGAQGILEATVVVKHQPHLIVVKQTNDRTTVNAAVGQTIQIQLHGNPSTGYEWSIHHLNGTSAVTSGAVVYQQDPAPSGMVGVGGIYYATFKAGVPGKTTITMVYQRPWEAAPIQTFRVTVNVVG